MGFKATEEVEELSYDFNPHFAAKGVIPEPTTDAVEAYRRVIFDSIKDVASDMLDLDPETDVDKVDWTTKVDEVFAKSKEVEDSATLATAELTGLDPDMLFALPYRVRVAFMGWIMGVFLNPEA